MENYQHKNRRRRKALHDKRYKILDADGQHCIYCGELKQGLDHVPPLLEADRYSMVLWEYFFLVNSCQECNSMLGGKDIPLLHKRVKFLRKRYKQRYAKYLSQPKWKLKQLSKLGPNMVAYIEEHSRVKVKIKERLRYMKYARKRLGLNYI